MVLDVFYSISIDVIEFPLDQGISRVGQHIEGGSGHSEIYNFLADRYTFIMNAEKPFPWPTFHTWGGVVAEY